MSQDDPEVLTRRRFLTGTGGAAALAIAGCTQQGNGGGGDGGGTADGETDALSGQINIKGSSTVYPLAQAMSESFRNNRTDDVGFSITPTGTGAGFGNHFCEGATHFNNASRQITDGEQQMCSDNGIEPVELQVATDALTVVVNKNADWIDCITTEELATIWSAEEKPSKWSDVNDDWPDRDLNLFGPTTASGTYDYFHESVLGEDGEHRSDYQSTEQDQQIINGVNGSRGGLGYLGFAYYSSYQDQVKALQVDDGDGCVEPSLQTARSGEYTPLARPLFVYAKKSALAKDRVAAFARYWLENSTSEDLVADQVGYVPLSEEDRSAQQDKLETAIDEATA